MEINNYNANLIISKVTNKRIEICKAKINEFILPLKRVKWSDEILDCGTEVEALEILGFKYHKIAYLYFPKFWRKFTRRRWKSSSSARSHTLAMNESRLEKSRKGLKGHRDVAYVLQRVFRRAVFWWFQACPPDSSQNLSLSLICGMLTGVFA